eukprot:gene42146-38974_t
MFAGWCARHDSAVPPAHATRIVVPRPPRRPPRPLFDDSGTELDEGRRREVRTGDEFELELFLVQVGEREHGEEDERGHPMCSGDGPHHAPGAQQQGVQAGGAGWAQPQTGYMGYGGSAYAPGGAEKRRR